jgi:predicted P-loop ATPase
VVKELCGSQYFGDTLPEAGTKDANDYVRGKWIIEMSELSTLHSSDIEHMKSFITRKEEKYRPAYGRSEITYKRQCVFIGTTNKDTYFRDDTGNRRFWPVKIGKIDVAGVLRDRDQLWAEAVALFKAGTPWWMELDSDIEKTARKIQAARMVVPWYVEVWEDAMDAGEFPFMKPLITDEDMRKALDDHKKNYVHRPQIDLFMLSKRYLKLQAKDSNRVPSVTKKVWVKDEKYIAMSPRELADVLVKQTTNHKQY